MAGYKVIISIHEQTMLIKMFFFCRWLTMCNTYQIMKNNFQTQETRICHWKKRMIKTQKTRGQDIEIDFCCCRCCCCYYHYKSGKNFNNFILFQPMRIIDHNHHIHPRTERERKKTARSSSKFNSIRFGIKILHPKKKKNEKLKISEKQKKNFQIKKNRNFFFSFSENPKSNWKPK